MVCAFACFDCISMGFIKDLLITDVDNFDGVTRFDIEEQKSKFISLVFVFLRWLFLLDLAITSLHTNNFIIWGWKLWKICKKQLELFHGQLVTSLACSFAFIIPDKITMFYLLHGRQKLTKEVLLISTFLYFPEVFNSTFPYMTSFWKFIRLTICQVFAIEVQTTP